MDKQEKDLAVEITIRCEIDAEVCEAEGVPMQEVFKSLTCDADSTCDGFNLWADVDGKDCTEFFPLKCVQIVGKKVVDPDPNFTVEFVAQNLSNVPTKRYDIKFYPGNSDNPIHMGFDVPVDRDPEEYIDRMLDAMLNDFLRYNCDWEFVV